MSSFCQTNGVVRRLLVALTLCSFPVLAQSRHAGVDERHPVPPRLAVLIVIDQFRGDYLERWRSHFGEDGFARLEREGVSYQNCHYPYAATATGPGHASIVAGCSPAVHGIVGNEWLDKATGKTVNCVDSDRHSRVPALAPGGNTLRSPGKAKAGVSPERMMVPSFADALKKSSGNKSRVVALALKDRSAVLPGGLSPDACYWFDTHTGEFVTSTYYRDAPHPWVADYNRARSADRWFGKEWTRLQPSLDYDRCSGRDDVVGEGTGFAQGRTFPHPTTGALKQPGRAYYEALTFSPFGNELLFDLFKLAVESEQLGQRDLTDFLSVSFSSNDLIGHVWGPDSHEVLDVTLRTDRLVAELLNFLDARVGKDKYVVALTSDHGICPLPEVTSARGADAGRIDLAQLTKNAEKFLSDRFAAGTPSKWFEPVVSLWIDLNRQTVKSVGAGVDEVAGALAEWLKAQPGIRTVYTRRQIEELTADATVQSIKRCYLSERCGDVFVIAKPHYLFASTYWTGTTHGSPHGYDTHVPLVFLGPGMRRAVRDETSVTPLCIAAVLSKAVGINPAANVETPVPTSVFGPK